MNLSGRRVLPNVTPVEVAARFVDEFSEEGESAGVLLADWRERVVPLLTAIGSPRHFAYVNGSGAMIGILAEALAACTNTNAGAWKLGPAATEIERLRRAFSIAAPYLRGSLETEDVALDYLEYGPQMSRAFRALKVWMVLRFFGARGLRELFSKNLGLAWHLHNLVREHPDFEVLHEPTIYIYCFRYVPNSLAERQEEPEVKTRLDLLNQEIVEAIQRSGLALVMTTRIHGRVAIRMSLCSQRTLEEDVDATFEAIARWGRLLSRSSSVHNKKSTEMEKLSCSSEFYSLPTEISAT